MWLIWIKQFSLQWELLDIHAITYVDVRRTSLLW